MRSGDHEIPKRLKLVGERPYFSVHNSHTEGHLQSMVFMCFPPTSAQQAQQRLLVSLKRAVSVWRRRSHIAMAPVRAEWHCGGRLGVGWCG